VKHAKVSQAELILAGEGNDVVLTVVDKGVGFDPAALRGRCRLGGFGLASVRERLETLGGSFAIESSVGGGTRATLRLPLIVATPSPREHEEIEPADVESIEAPVPNPNSTIRVILADDHRILRQSLANLLAKEPDLDVVGLASTGDEAIELTRKLSPDVVVMDITMPGMGGIEATRHLVKENPGLAVVSLSMHEEEAMASAMKRAGASACLTKGGPAEILITEIRKFGKRAGAGNRA